MDINENTEIHIPLRNLVAIGTVLCLFLGQWFILDNRVDKLENDVLRLTERGSKNTEFRYLQAPQDTEQTLRLTHIEAAISRIEKRE